MKILPNARTTIVGTSGSGKSYFCKKLIKKFLIMGHRIVVWDLKLEYLGKHAIDIDYGSTKAYITHDAKTLEEALEGRDAQFVVIQPNMAAGSATLTFARVCEYIYKQHNLVFVVDELQHMQSKQSITPALKAIITQKRAHGVGFIGISQRFSHIHNDLLSQSSNLLSFAQHNPSDIKQLQDYFGGIKVPCYECGGKGCKLCNDGMMDSEKYAYLAREPYFRMEHLYLHYTDSGDMKIVRSPR
jgi:DNA helicase HerA-like ATPase